MEFCSHGAGEKINTVEFRRYMFSNIHSPGRSSHKWDICAQKRFQIADADDYTSSSPPMAANADETLHWITLVASFAASAPEFVFTPQIGAQHQAPPLSQLEESYLVHGLSKLRKFAGVTDFDFLSIEQYSASTPATGPASSAPPSASLLSRSSPSSTPHTANKESRQPTLGAHVVNALAPAIGATLEPGLQGMVRFMGPNKPLD